MGKRFFWLVLGVGLTVVAVRKGRKLYRRYTPKGIAERVENTQHGIAAFASDFLESFTEAMGEREAEIRQALGEPEA